MSYMAIFIAKFLDPVSFLLCLAVAFIFKKAEKWELAFCAVIVALIVEGFLTSSQIARHYGEGLIIGVPVSLLHMYLGYLIRNLKNKKEN